MHRFWLGLHILLIMCLIPGPSWANTSKLAQKSDLTVENVWQHEVQKNRQAMKIKMLRDMGLKPMSALADEMSLKIKKIYDNEINKTKTLPTEEADEARRAIRASLFKFINRFDDMYATMKKYKENKIGATRARRHMQSHYNEIYDFCRSSFGSKVMALLQDETQKNLKQNIIFVRGELGADFKNEYKKALQNPTTAEQILKPFKDILPTENNRASETSQFPIKLKDDITQNFFLKSVNKKININKIHAAALILFAAMALELLIVSLASVSLFVFGFGVIAFAVVAPLMVLVINTTNNIRRKNRLGRGLQTFLKYNLFLETKRRADSKLTR